MGNHSVRRINALFYLAIILIPLSSAVHAVEYRAYDTVANSPGGARFESDVGRQYSQQTMEAATSFIWNIFQETNPSDRKYVESVSLCVDDDTTDHRTSFVRDNQIHVNARYIENFAGDLKTEMTGLIYHETTHIWQWTGNGQAVPEGLIEGIADFVRLRAGYAPCRWVGPGQGDRWDQGYDVTARFLDYCDRIGGGTFVAQLNRKMRDGYSEGFFQELLGKCVHDLWMDYKSLNLTLFSH